VISEEEFIQRGVAVRLMHLGICSSACGLLLLLLPPDAVLYLWRFKHEYGSGKIFLLLLILCGLWLAVVCMDALHDAVLPSIPGDESSSF
jgi:hypothetical protein